jgi:predicted DNA-binding antitoxin AbrB/MazE fold protein
MLKKFKAVYRDGAFILQEPCQLAENTEVELIVSKSHGDIKDIIDSDVRKEILHALLQRMRQTSLANASGHLSSVE